jgi:hypothetical protein
VTQISSSNQAFGAFIADKRLTRKEITDLQSLYQKEKPGATAPQFELWLEQNLAGKTGIQDAHASLSQIKSGSSESVYLFFDDASPAKIPPEPGKAAPVQVHVEGLKIIDKNGFEQRSADDLSGSAQKIDVTLSQDFLKQIAQGVVDKIMGVGQAELSFVPGKVGEPGFHSISVAGQHLANLRSENGRLFVEMALGKPLPEGVVAPHLDQTPNGFTQAISDALNWTGTQANGAFDAVVSGVGQDPKAVRESISKNLDSALAWSGEKILQGASSLSGKSPEDLQRLLQGQFSVDAGSGIQSDIDLDLDLLNTRIYINPGNLTLNGKDLGGQGSVLDGSRVTLEPEKPHLTITDDGQVKISSENARIYGGTGDTSQAIAAPSANVPSADTLTLDNADAELRVEADRTSLEITDAKGQIQASGLLTDERIQILKKEIDDALSAIDTKLKAYGVSRSDIEKILSKIPTDLLKSLLSSTNQGELAQAAANLGIDPTQLGQFVTFLQQEPVQGLLGDLQKLTGTLAADTHLQGTLDFRLGRLNLESGAENFLIQIQALDFKTFVKSETPTGTQTEGALTGHIDSAALAKEGANLPQISTTQASIGVDVTIQAEQPTFEQKFAQFKSELLNMDAQKLLTPQGITPGRTGLSIKSVNALLVQLNPQEWSSVAQADDKALQVLATQKKIKPNYLAYMRKYFQDQGFLAREQSQVTAQASVQSLSSDAKETKITGPGATAEVKTQANGELISDANVGVSADQVKVNPVQAAIEAAAKLMGFRLELAQKSGKALLTPHGISAGRSGLSFDSVKGIMAKVSDPEWRKLPQMTPAERAAFAQKKDIPGNYLSYMLDYFQKNAMLPAAGVASGIQIEADAAVKGPEGTTTSHVNTDIDSLRVSPEVISAQGIQGQGHLDTPGADVDMAFSQGDLSASQERILAAARIEQASVTSENGKFNTQGQLWGSAENGLAIDAKTQWDLDTTGPKTHTTLSGNTDLAISDGRLTGSETEQLQGVSRIRSDELMRLAKNHPDLQAFLKMLGNQFSFKNPTVAVRLSESSLVTDDKGRVDFNLKLGVQKVETSLGQMDLQVRASNQGVKGQMNFSPNQMAMAWINGMISEAVQKPTQTQLNQGRVEVKFDQGLVNDILIGAKIQGDKVEIKVNQAKLFGFLDLGVIRGGARDAILEQLKKQGITRVLSSGDATVTIPMQSLMAQSLGADAAKRTVIKPILGADNRLHVDFDYRP